MVSCIANPPFPVASGELPPLTDVVAWISNLDLDSTVRIAGAGEKNKACDRR